MGGIVPSQLVGIRRLDASQTTRADRARSDTAILDWLETHADLVDVARWDRDRTWRVRDIDRTTEGRSLRDAARRAMDAMADGDARHQDAIRERPIKQI